MGRFTSLLVAVGLPAPKRRDGAQIAPNKTGELETWTARLYLSLAFQWERSPGLSYGYKSREIIQKQMFKTYQ